MFCCWFFFFFLASMPRSLFLHCMAGCIFTQTHAHDQTTIIISHARASVGTRWSSITSDYRPCTRTGWWRCAGLCLGRLIHCKHHDHSITTTPPAPSHSPLVRLRRDDDPHVRLLPRAVEAQARALGAPVDKNAMVVHHSMRPVPLLLPLHIHNPLPLRQRQGRVLRGERRRHVPEVRVVRKGVERAAGSREPGSMG